MKKKILKKLERAFLKIADATDALYDAKDELICEDIKMITRNQSLQDIVKETCSDLEYLKSGLASTLKVLKDEDTGQACNS